MAKLTLLVLVLTAHVASAIVLNWEYRFPSATLSGTAGASPLSGGGFELEWVSASLGGVPVLDRSPHIAHYSPGARFNYALGSGRLAEDLDAVNLLVSDQPIHEGGWLVQPDAVSFVLFSRYTGDLGLELRRAAQFIDRSVGPPALILEHYEQGEVLAASNAWTLSVPSTGASGAMFGFACCGLLLFSRHRLVAN